MKKIILMVVSLTFLLTICNASPLINNVIIDLGNLEKPKLPILGKSIQTYNPQTHPLYRMEFEQQEAEKKKRIKRIVILIVVGIAISIGYSMLVKTANKIFIFKYKNDIIQVKNAYDHAELLVNNKLQDRITGVQTSVSLYGKLDSGEEIKADIFAAGLIHIDCKLRVDNQIIIPETIAKYP